MYRVVLSSLFVFISASVFAQTSSDQPKQTSADVVIYGGTSAGVIAAVIACVQVWRQHNSQSTERPIVVLPRNVHKSAVHALVLSGAEPCWLLPELDVESGLCLGVATASVEAALRLERKRLAMLLMDTFIKYPLPEALVPYNYCALPRLLPRWAQRVAGALLRPVCRGVE